MFNLSKRRVLVTGATGGIGSSIAKLLLQQDAQVILHSTSEKKLEHLAHQLTQNGCSKENIHFAPWNFLGQSPEGFWGHVEEKYGPIDSLINNAGITRDNLCIRMKDEEWDSVILLNLTTVFKLSSQAIRTMMKRKFGRIINISSVVATMGNPGQANYCAAKAGIIGMSKAMALEIASRGITINCVAPGFIESPMSDTLTPEQQEKITANIPMKRVGTGGEVAAACFYLLSKEASYITGQTLHVNGGLEMI